MARRRRRPQRQRRTNGRSNGVIDLTHFNNRRRFRVAYGLTCTGTQDIYNYQVNKRSLGSEFNPLWSQFTAVQPGFPLEQIRVLSVKVEFDNRGIGTTAFASNIRVGANILPYTDAQLNTTKPLQSIGQFAGPTVDLRKKRVFFLRVGQEFPVGNFGTLVPGDTRLMLYASGFEGEVRATVTYEVCGYPNQTLPLLTQVGPEPSCSTFIMPDDGGEDLTESNYIQPHSSSAQ